MAGSIVVFNLDTKQVKWTAELDLSTDTGDFRAFIYSSPTVIDLDGDGYMDILVGTSFGLFYVLDHKGKPLYCTFLYDLECMSVRLFYVFYGFSWNKLNPITSACIVIFSRCNIFVIPKCLTIFELMKLVKPFLMPAICIRQLDFFCLAMMQNLEEHGLVM